MNKLVHGSLRGQLLLLLSLGLALIWLLAATLTTLKTRHEMGELLDAHLVQSASLLLARISEDADEIDADHAPVLNRYTYPLAFQIWDGEQLRMHSANAPAQHLGPQLQGFSDNRVDGKDWRTFSTSSQNGRYRVQVGELQAVRSHMTGNMLMQLLSPLLVALPLLALLVWLVVARALRPISTLSSALASQHADNLHPVTVTVPHEMAPLTTHLNMLLERLAASFENERRFTSDAAHELRTPLAALHTQLQVAQGASDENERKRAIAMALAAGERSARLVQQLLTLARLDHDAWQHQAAPVILPDLTAQVLGMMAEEAANNGIALCFESNSTKPELTIKGHADLLSVLIRNLVDNAVRYSPSGSAVTVGLSAEAGAVVLFVLDEGPGIAPEKREEALRRFHRLDKSGRHGSGLGLSIVARIAELHGAALTLCDGRNECGLRVDVRFPIQGDATSPVAVTSGRRQ